MAQQTNTSKKSTTTKKPKAATTRTSKLGALELSPDDRFRMIAETAYLKAEQRGFEGDKSMEDWLQAEAEVDARFSAQH